MGSTIDPLIDQMRSLQSALEAELAISKAYRKAGNDRVG